MGEGEGERERERVSQRSLSLEGIKVWIDGRKKKERERNKFLCFHVVQKNPIVFTTFEFSLIGFNLGEV